MGDTQLSLSGRIEGIIVSYIEKLVAPRVTSRPTLMLLKSRMNKEKGKNAPKASRTMIENKLTKRTCRHHSRVLLILAYIYVTLLIPEKRCTEREVYYHFVNFFENQAELNGIILEVANMLEVPRHFLGVLTSSRGLVHGNVSITINRQGVSTELDCVQGSQMIPTNIIDSQVYFKSTARFIIVIEKEGIFSNLVAHNFCGRVPSILVTGFGYPSYVCRTLVHKLSESLQIPTVALCDYNPHGLQIFLTYKLGSVGLPEGDKVLVPNLKWLGLMKEDIQALELHQTQLQPLSRHDIRLITNMLQRSFFLSPEGAAYAKILRDMHQFGQKAELQALYQLGQSFLSCEYLPSKVLSRKFL